MHRVAPTSFVLQTIKTPGCVCAVPCFGRRAAAIVVCVRVRSSDLCVWRNVLVTIAALTSEHPVCRVCVRVCADHVWAYKDNCTYAVSLDDLPWLDALDALQFPCPPKCVRCVRVGGGCCRVAVAHNERRRRAVRLVCRANDPDVFACARLR